MRTISTIALLLAFFTTIGQVTSQSKSDQRRTIEINNENGELTITFENNVITEFTVNDTPVDEGRYGDYQEIIDDFNGEDVSPTPPTPPAPPVEVDDNKSQDLRIAIIDYLSIEHLITSATKFKVDLNKGFLRVNGEEASNQIHEECLNLFHEIYGHRLNSKSKVRFRKSRNNSTSTISILE